MADRPIAQQHHETFEGIRQLDPDGNEFWLARQLAKVLDYSQYRHFLPVIERAKEACVNSGQPVIDHIEDVLTMVDIGSGAKRQVEDFRLSRYACYLIVQNGDPGKSVIANGQTYFAMQTRRQELADDAKFRQLNEDEKRLAIRNELAAHNKHLAAAAKEAGVETGIDFAIFQDHGYKGLYGGLGNKEIHARKGLKKSQKILDHMGSTELAANLFRATQTEEKLRRDEVSDKSQANKTHFEVGRKVRETIAELGGTMPEGLPTPDSSIQKLESAKKKLAKMVSFMQTPEYMDFVINGIGPDGTVHWAGSGITNCLREAETKLAQAGWTPLFEAIRWIAKTYPEQTPKRYGCGSWRHVIHASQQFEIRKQSQADNGATVVWYRSRPRETSKEQ